MKLQKNIIIWSLIIMLLSISGIFFFDTNIKFYDICVGVFTGVILTLTTTIILYNYEKNKLINKIYSNFSEIYYVLCTIYLKLGKFLEVKDLSDTKFSLNYKLAMQISDTMANLRNDEFTSFWDCKLHNQIKKLNNFSSKLYNLKNIIEVRNIDILQFEIAVKENILNNQPNMNNNQDLFKFREDLLIAIGRIHEYSCSLKIELNEIMIGLDSICKFNNRWNDKKSYFEKDMEARKNDL